MFERLLFNNMFSFFSENDLKLPKQSGFRPGDSCTKHLLSSTREIISVFNVSHDVRGIFLDISKAFDRVWHVGRADYFNKIAFELQKTESCVKWSTFVTGVHQGSILGPLLFLIYINDLPNGLNSNVKFFADDTWLFSVVNNITVLSNLLNR